MKKDLISLKHWSAAELTTVIQQAVSIKKNPAAYANALAGRNLLMLFQKTSTRTRLSFELGIQELGGRAVVMDWDKSNFAISPICYEARYVSRHVDLIMARLIQHEQVLELAAGALVPVINGCCNRYHPTQGLADLLTIYEESGQLAGVTLAYVGIHNNVANSLVAGGTKLGVKVILVTPEINAESWDAALMAEAEKTGLLTVTKDIKAIRQADYVYTDTWVDMENFHNPDYAAERERRLQVMSPYKLRPEILSPNQIIMHDMPIHPGWEIAPELVDAPQSRIFNQAENRLHAEKSAMLHLLA